MLAPEKWLLGFWLNKPTNINLSPITWMSVDPENCWKNPPTAARSSICLWCGGAFKLNQGVLSLVSTLTTKPVISLPVETLHTHSDEDIKKGKADTHTYRQSYAIFIFAVILAISREQLGVLHTLSDYQLNHRHKEASVSQITLAKKTAKRFRCLKEANLAGQRRAQTLQDGSTSSKMASWQPNTEGCSFIAECFMITQHTWPSLHSLPACLLLQNTDWILMCGIFPSSLVSASSWNYNVDATHKHKFCLQHHCRNEL